MNPTTCPGCAAPLDPLATKCVYCNFVTPRGRVEAERADYEAHARQAQAQAYAANQASMAQAAAAQEVANNAKYSLIATLVGFVSCCAPVGWLGAFFAYRSLSLAAKHSIPKPASAIVSAVLAGLGTCLTLFVFVGSHFDQKDKEKRIAAIEARADAGRKKATLDAKTACDITEAYLLRSNKMTTNGEMVCKASPELNGATARLNPVTVTADGVTKGTYRVCLAKSARWFVVNADTKSDDCIDEAPAAANETEEQVARDTYAALLEQARVRSASKKLTGAKGAVDRAAPGERGCTEAALASAKETPVVRAVDYAVLDGKSDADFSFLSDKDLLAYFTKGSAKEKSDVAAKVTQGAPYLVVYRHKSRQFPEVSEKGEKGDFGLVAGDYEGTLYVVDTRASEVVCQGPIAWKTPAKAPFSLSRKSTKFAIQDRAETDYKQRFHDAATDRLKALTSGKLRLGYKPIE